MNGRQDGAPGAQDEQTKGTAHSDIDGHSRSPDGVGDSGTRAGNSSFGAQLSFESQGCVSPLEPPRAVFAVAPAAKVSEAYDAWWRYAFERQRIYYRRLRGERPPWTDDKILRRYRFTNVYRAADRVSQYLIQHVIYQDGLPVEREEVVFRILLFKLFNRVATWETLSEEIGALTLADDPFDRIDEILSSELRAGRPIYSAAYIMPTVRGGSHKHKHSGHLALLRRMMEDLVPERLARVGSMKAGFDLLRSYSGVGDFLAYQLITDINYSEVVDFTETEFVSAGPGAQEGLRKCFVDPGGRSDEDLIRLMMNSQEEEFARLGLDFEDLFGRPLQLIDCQNVFCEVAKYARAKFPELTPEGGRKRIKQRFEEAKTGIEAPCFPPKWRINDAVESSLPRIVSISSFDLGDYQRKARETIGHGVVEGGDAITTPMLGLIGETGEVVTELKKRAQEGMAYVSFRKRLVEELGDLLWYAADLATHRGIDLQEVDRQADDGSSPAQSSSWIRPALGLANTTGRISHAYGSLLAGKATSHSFDAELRSLLVALLMDVRALTRIHTMALAEVAGKNLEKVRERYTMAGRPRGVDHETLLQSEELPVQFDAVLTDGEDQSLEVSFFIDGNPWPGTQNTLTDNAHVEDGYRFHDVFHFAYAAILGWSPVTRRLMGIKRKSVPRIDEVEDGARAAAIEEGISAMVFEVARQHRMFRGVREVDGYLLRTIRDVTQRLEVRDRTEYEWQLAILQGYRVWRNVREAGGGRVRVDRANRAIEFIEGNVVVVEA